MMTLSNHLLRLSSVGSVRSLALLVVLGLLPVAAMAEPVFIGLRTLPPAGSKPAVTLKAAPKATPKTSPVKTVVAASIPLTSSPKTATPVTSKPAVSTLSKGVQATNVVQTQATTLGKNLPAKAATQASTADLPALRSLPPTKAVALSPSKPVTKAPVVPVAVLPTGPSDSDVALRSLPATAAAPTMMAVPSASPAPVTPSPAPSPGPARGASPTGATTGPLSSPMVLPVAGATLPSRSAVQIVTDSATQQLPAGTLLRLNFQTGLSSAVSQTGEPFTALLGEDLMGTRGELLLPKGTALRGRIAEVQSSRFFSKGGLISLAFDHVVLPSGQQLPVELQLSTDEQAGLVNQQGVLYTDPGMVAKLNGSVNDGTELFYKTTRAGINAGKDIGHGAGMILTVPVAAVGGALAGTGVAAGKSAYNLVAKGKDVLLEPGQPVLVRLSKPTTFPVAD